MKIKETEIGILGLLSISTFIASLLIFGFSNSDFSFVNDFVSKLGAKGEPNALWFNLFGFITVGILLFVFGVTYGNLLNDKLLSILLSLSGLGFAFIAIPIDMELSRTPMSKAHIVSTCLGLAFWLLGLSRLAYNRQLREGIRKRANFTTTVLILSIIVSALELWSTPITHRLIFGIVFGWYAITSFDLILRKGRNKKTAYNIG
ncbi:DUF998 domain-containing protein [Maribacter antarcticus]|uniref:DUF998 domain-containing protein n=1 Tax=Maribacter antarcticus TaxID=505250 RepID=UPI000688C7DE|nr:DUF998 domain-containing protein [Maribacter antarcticus]